MCWLLSLIGVAPALVAEISGFLGSLALLAPVAHDQRLRLKARRQRSRPVISGAQRRFRGIMAESYDRRAAAYTRWHARTYIAGAGLLALSFWLAVEREAGWCPGSAGIAGAAATADPGAIGP